MSRIDEKFKELRLKGKKAFIAYITAGDPDLKTTEELVIAFEKSGVDVVELGVPFSDPLADGPTIQAAAQRALENGTTLKKILGLVLKLRSKTNIPIALMTYYNPIFHYGEDNFVLDASTAGVDGLIIPDLPPEEASELSVLAKQYDVSTVFFISPTTTRDRQKYIDRSSTGFVYYVSVAGVTGARSGIPQDILLKVKKAKELVDKPICVGFGISTPEQVESISKVADGVIVGSAIVKEINKHAGKKDCIKKVSKFVRKLNSKL